MLRITQHDIGYNFYRILLTDKFKAKHKQQRKKWMFTVHDSHITVQNIYCYIVLHILSFCNAD